MGGKRVIKINKMKMGEGALKVLRRSEGLKIYFLDKS